MSGQNDVRKGKRDTGVELEASDAPLKVTDF